MSLKFIRTGCILGLLGAVSPTRADTEVNQETLMHCQLIQSEELQAVG